MQVFQLQQHQKVQPANNTKETRLVVPEPGPTKSSTESPVESTPAHKRNSYESENTLSICTHNIRGINKETDQDTLIQYLSEENIDIIGLSETKLNSANGDWAFKDYRSKFKCFSSTSDVHPQGSGVALLIEKEMAKHVYSVQRIEGHIIVAVLLFRQSRITIMQVYLPSNKKESNRYQRLIRSIINEEAKHKNSRIIVMGDFNAVVNPATDRPSSSVRSHKWKPEAEIFYFLEDWGFTDIHNLWEMEIPSPTWYSSRSHSRIDYIWISDNIAINNVHSFSNQKINNVTESDHTLLTIKLFRKNFASSTKQKTSKAKGFLHILDTGGTTEEQWQDYQDKIEKQLKGNIVWEKMAFLYHKALNESDICRETIQTELQEIWNVIENIIKKTAWRTLKKKKIKKTKGGEEKELWQPKEVHNHRNARHLLKLIQIESRKNKTDNSLTDLNKISKGLAS
jgi:exonuclease III